MEVVVTTGAQLQSNYHHQQINTQLFTGCRPTNTVKALKGKVSHSMDLLTRAHLGVFHASHQPSDASTPELRTLPLVNQAQVLYNLCVNYFVAKFCEPKNQISPV